MVKSITNLLFDLLLFTIIFPYFIKYNNYYSYFNQCIFLIILSHIYILYMRYFKNSEIIWHIIFDIIAIIFGYIIYLDGKCTQSQVIIYLGLIMMYGHIRKIIYPNKSYYF